MNRERLLSLYLVHPKAAMACWKQSGWLWRVG